jgi:hypothetical protein
MGIKGSKNVPITARVSSGLFNQKKGVTEPLLNVGPAGVHGNNQTRDIPSPSKMKGYTMKASPFKQKATEVGVKVVKQEKEPDTETEVNVPGKDVTTYTKPTRTKEGDAAYAKLTPEQRKAQDNKYIKKNTKTVKGEDVKKKEVVKGKTTEKEEFTPNQTKDKGDAQTALERRNTIRSGKVAARTEKAAQRKIDRLDRQDGTATKTKKEQRSARKRTQAESNREVSRNAVEGAKNQSAQNIKGSSDKAVKSKERAMTLSDVGNKSDQDAVIKEGGASSGSKKSEAKSSNVGLKAKGVKDVSKAPSTELAKRRKK